MKQEFLSSTRAIAPAKVLSAALGCCLALLVGCGRSPGRPTLAPNLSVFQVLNAFAKARLRLVRIGPPLPTQRDRIGIQRFFDRINDFTTGVDVVGGTDNVFGAARMPSRLKVLVYKTPRSAVAALALGQRLIAEGQLPQPSGPVMIRRARNVVIEIDAAVYAKNARSIQRALQNVHDRDGTRG